MKRLSISIYFFLLTVVSAPLIYLLISSLYIDHQGISLRQYAEVVHDASFRQAVFNSLKISVCTLICQTPVSIIVGLTLAKARLNGKRVILTILLLSALMPFQAILFPVYQAAVRTELYNSHTLLVLLYAFSPVGALIMSVFIGSIPQEHLDVAMLETNSLLRVFQYVVFPQIKNGILVLWFISFADSWGMVEQPLILLASHDLKPLSLILNDYLTQNGGYGDAGAVIYALPIIVLFVLLCFFSKFLSHVSANRQ